jgi:glycerophosphoryl diester phosphodiesterase
MDWIKQSPIAHRGLHRGRQIPENSLAAFEAAMAANHPIELDIQPLADGHVAVFHDKTLERLTGQPGYIAEQTLDSLPNFRLFDSDQTIPSLAETLALIRGQVPVLVEIKNEGKVGPLESALYETLQGYKGEVAIQSFNPFSLRWFKQNAPTIPRGQLAGDFKQEPLPWYNKLLLSNLLMNWASDPQFIAYDLRALPSLPTTLNRQLFQTTLITWTVRTAAERDRAEEVADNYIFDAF